MKNVKKQPLVSIVMTAYNAAKFVAEAVESIQSQTYANWELIIVNDGSTDSTGKILRDVARNDDRILLISCRINRGASHASNLGLLKANGKFIARMDADDVAMPERIAQQVKFLQNNPRIIVVGGQCELIDRKGKTIGIKSFPTKHQEIYEALYQYNPIQHPSLMINTSLVDKDKITYHTTVQLAHDLEILFKLAQYGELANLPEKVLKYRIHNDSLSLRDPKETFRHTLVVRELARKVYGYMPSMNGRLTHGLQKIVMIMLPSLVVYPVFRFFRMRKVREIRTQVKYVAAIIMGIISR